MRSVFFPAVAILLLCGCSKPPVVAIKRKSRPLLAYVRILNLTHENYSLSSKDRPLYGSVEPGQAGLFNYLAPRYGPPFALDSKGKKRDLASVLNPGQVTTYALLPNRVVQLDNEPRLPRSTKFSTVCFRSLTKNRTINLVDGSGKTMALDAQQAFVLDSGTYKVRNQVLDLAPNLAYTIVEVAPDKPLLLLQNSPTQPLG